MGVIRGSLFVIVSVLLLIFLLAGNLFLTVNISLNYENIKPKLVEEVRSLAIEDFNLKKKVNEDYPKMQTTCETNSEYVFSQNSEVFVIPCEVIAQGSEPVLEYSINSLIEEYYYKEYDCDFLDCFKEGEPPFFIISKTAQDYCKSKFFLALIISLILIALMFLLIENRTNLPIVVGTLLVISSLPFIKLNWLFSIFAEKSFLGFFSILVNRSYKVFLISAILGVILVGIGIAMKFFRIGFKISEIFSKFSKNKDEKISIKPAKKKSK